MILLVKVCLWRVWICHPPPTAAEPLSLPWAVRKKIGLQRLLSLNTAISGHQDRGVTQPLSHLQATTWLCPVSLHPVAFYWGALWSVHEQRWEELDHMLKTRFSEVLLPEKHKPASCFSSWQYFSPNIVLTVFFPRLKYKIASKWAYVFPNS